MCHHAALVLGQLGQGYVPGNGLRHTGDGMQGIAVAGVQLLRHQHQRLALGKDGVAAGGVGIVHHAHVGHGQAGGCRKLGGGHPHLFHMGLQAALCQLPKDRVFAGLRVGGGGDERADILLEFIGGDGIVLFIGHAEDVLLGRGVKLQRNGGVGHGAHIVVDEGTDGALQTTAAKGLVAGGVPDQRLHHRTPHPVGLSRRRPAAAVGAQHDDGGVGIEIDQRRPPAVFLVLVLCCVDDGQPAVDAPFLAVPERGGRGRGVEANAAADVRICGQGGEHAAVFQLISAGLGIGRNQTVICHQLLQPVQRAAVAHKAIEHTAGCQCIHCLLSPVAAHLQLVQPLR